ncbi:MAG: DUF362 domain-containing protein [Armatimonadia bacterium]
MMSLGRNSHNHKGFTYALVVWVLMGSLCGVAADPGREPGPATVAVVTATGFLGPDSFLTPQSIYPLGKQDYRTVARMLDRAAMLATSTTRISDAWASLVSSSDRVGILIDVQQPPVSLTLLDAVLDRVTEAGVRPSNIIVWAEDERSLFSAGLALCTDTDGVRILGAESEGFRDGLSRIVLNYCDVLINVSRLRPDRRIGMWGATANQTACVPQVDRLRLLAKQQELPSAAARPSCRTKFRLHLVDALQPSYEPGAQKMPPYWNCGTLLASADCVAVDVTGRQLLEAKRGQVHGVPWPLDPEPVYLKSACEGYRLGQWNPQLISTIESSVTN